MYFDLFDFVHPYKHVRAEPGIIQLFFEEAITNLYIYYMLSNCFDPEIEFIGKSALQFKK